MYGLKLLRQNAISNQPQNWNKLLAECVERAVNDVLPVLCNELKKNLLTEAKEAVLNACARKIHNCIKIAPYCVSFPEQEYWETLKGLRVLGIAYKEDNLQQVAYCALVTPDGKVPANLRLLHILKPRNFFLEVDGQLIQADIFALKNFIKKVNPHLVAIGGESFKALMIQKDVREIIKELIKDEEFPDIQIEIVDSDLATIYSNSKKGISDFPEYQEVLRQAISIARKMQDPLIEYSQLCNPEKDILSLRLHPLQDQLDKDELLEVLYLEFINHTNEVGLDINLLVEDSRAQYLVQFLCGFGSCKSAALIKSIEENGASLYSRFQLQKICNIGPTVFRNCSGFIKIETRSNNTQASTEILDRTRVHPESYEWARQITELLHSSCTLEAFERKGKLSNTYLPT